MRGKIVLLVIVGLALAGGASAASSRRHVCRRPARASVLASNRKAVLFSRGGERFYGCLKALGVTRLLLDERFNFYFDALIAVKLAGRFAALEPAYSNGSAAWKDAVLYDLRSGKARRLADVFLHDPGRSTVDGLDFLALDSSGFAAWRETSRPVPVGLAAMSCPSASLCVAGDDDGNILASTDPLGGPDAWSRTAADQVQGVGQDIVGVSCASVSLCVVADGSEGDILVSTDPTGGQSAWTKRKIALGGGLEGVSCPSVTLCVAVGSDLIGPRIFTSSDPDDTSTWSSARVGSGGDALAVSCPSVSLCVAGTDAGDVLTSTDPTGGASAWKQTPTGSRGSPVAISCPSVSLCVALTDAGGVLTSTDPTGGASAWHKAKLERTDSLYAVSCQSVSLCVAVDVDGNIFTSTNPTGGRSAWMKVPADRAHSLHAVSCASVSMCVAGDGTGNILTSTDPDDGANAWSRPTVVPGCPRPSTPCISEQLYAHDDQGTRVVDTAPPGHGNSIGNVAFASRGLAWTHDGTPESAQLN